MVDQSKTLILRLSEKKDQDLLSIYAYTLQHNISFADICRKILKKYIKRDYTLVAPPGYALYTLKPSNNGYAFHMTLYAKEDSDIIEFIDSIQKYHINHVVKQILKYYFSPDLVLAFTKNFNKDTITKLNKYAHESNFEQMSTEARYSHTYAVNNKTKPAKEKTKSTKRTYNDFLTPISSDEDIFDETKNVEDTTEPNITTVSNDIPTSENEEEGTSITEETISDMIAEMEQEPEPEIENTSEEPPYTASVFSFGDDDDDDDDLELEDYVESDEEDDSDQPVATEEDLEALLNSEMFGN